MIKHQREVDHLTTEQVAAMLDRRLSAEERRAAVAHLSVCADCRHEVSELQRALRATGHRRQPTWRWALGISAVAAALVIVAVPLAVRPGRKTIDPLRAEATRAAKAVQSEANGELHMVAPLDSQAITATRSLTWRAAGVGASYLVTVQDTSGKVIWSSPLADTTATIPAGVSLVAGHWYFWTVDARLADGTSAATAPRVFTVR